MTVVGIDVSKGKSMVAAMKPGGELVAAPYEVRHSDIELSHLALDVLCMEPDTRVVMEATGSLVLADDSGLEVDYLNKEPGVYSARYMGENTSYRIKNQIILDRLHGVPDIVRSARFVCVIAAAFPDGRVETRRATIEGRIAQEPAGENGFGYDPIFYLPEKGKTTAQLSAEEKNEISHRGKALRQIKEIL